VDDALKKLNTGKGNLLGRARKIKELGARTTKTLPDQLLESADEDPAEDDASAPAPPTDAGLRH
jgi:DNA recombination protein RmuC